MDATKTSLDVLFVDDDPDFRQAVAARFRREGMRVEEAGDAAGALEWMAQRHFDVVVADMIMPGQSGLELLDRIKNNDVDSEVVLLTGAATIESAVESMRHGAYDFLTKPTRLEALLATVQKAAERGGLRKENTRLKEAERRMRPSGEILGESAPIKELLRLIERAGPSGKPILIQGETGTGKELVARALHRASGVADKPLVTINCAALTETLLESELFGHERGAFTGATTTKQGLFEVADGGTLFIDEMGEMPGSLQAKLLRVLEDGSIRRVGSVKERRVKVRLIAATNRNLAKEVEASRFREDLFYRINVMCLELPALRDRLGDVPLLVRHFLGPQWQIAPAAMHALETFPWPGNIRQLLNALERAKIMADEQEIYLEDLPPDIASNVGLAITGNPAAASSRLSGEDNLETLQKSKIVEILAAEHGNKARAARRLGISRRSLYRALEKFQIE